MKNLLIPFSPFPFNVLLKVGSVFIPLSVRLGKAFPYLDLDLKQAELDIDSKHYLAIAIFLSIFYFIALGSFGALLLSKFSKDYLLLGFSAGLLLSFLIFMQLSLFPKILVKKKVRNIERNLLFAMRTMLVQIKSGISLFDSMNVVSRGNYGVISVEFGKAVSEINAGMMQEKVLQDLAANNPSSYFRKALWQIVNGMKAGTDISTILIETVNSLVREQKIAIARFGANLRMLSLVYMMLGVIVPALGLTFLIILASFPQIKVTESMFWILLGFTSIAQFMYIGIIKSNRPNLLGEA